MKTKGCVWAVLMVVCAVAVPARAQNICLVTADFEEAQDFIVVWEPFADPTNMDSVLIYRKAGTESTFTRVGAVDIGPEEQTYYRDQTANTMDSAKYAIAILDSAGNIGPLSPWHQGVLMDYQGNGEFWWTPYKKEDQVDDSYIYGYEFQTDASGFGNFMSNATMANDEFYWLDEMYQFQPDAYYVVLAQLPDCQFWTKANINTSRSNIKQQFANAAAGVDEKTLIGMQLLVAPNPVNDLLNITFAEEMTHSKVWISGVNGGVETSREVSGKTTAFTVSDLAPGVYFVNALHNGVVTTVKWIRQ